MLKIDAAEWHVYSKAHEFALAPVSRVTLNTSCASPLAIYGVEAETGESRFIQAIPAGTSRFRQIISGFESLSIVPPAKTEWAGRVTVVTGQFSEPLDDRPPAPRPEPANALQAMRNKFLTEMSMNREDWSSMYEVHDDGDDTNDAEFEEEEMQRLRKAQADAKKKADEEAKKPVPSPEPTPATPTPPGEQKTEQVAPSGDKPET